MPSLRRCYNTYLQQQPTAQSMHEEINTTMLLRAQHYNNITGAATSSQEDVTINFRPRDTHQHSPGVHVAPPVYLSSVCVVFFCANEHPSQPHLITPAHSS